MIFLEQRRELASQLGLDQNNADMDTRLKRWLNMSQRLILGAYPWPFLRASNPLIIQTVTDYSTGTVATVANSTTITFSGTIADSKTNYYIQFSDSDDWYRITAHTAGTATATIDPGAIYTNGTATFTIRKFYYSLSSAVDRILSIRQWINPFYLTEMTKEMFDSMQPIFNTTGEPKNFMVVGKDSSDIWQVQFWPNPSSVMNMFIEYLQMVNDLSGDNDVSIIPSKWHATIMIEGAKIFGYNYRDDTREADTTTRFYKMLQDMKDELMPSKSLHRRMRAADAMPYLNEFPYPSNYPNA